MIPENAGKVKRNVKRYLKEYLKQVVFCGETIPSEVMSEGILYITDSEASLRTLKEMGAPVAAWLHEGNREQNLSEAAYAIENPREVEREFYERIYRREKNIPWEILETERCVVREMIPEDAEAFAAIYREPTVSEYMKDFHGDVDGERRYIEEYQQQYRFYEYGVWSVVLKETGEVIGRVGFSEAENICERSEVMDFRRISTGKVPRAEDNAEGDCLPVQDFNGEEGAEWLQFGYVIGVPWQGRGLAYEICRAVLDYAVMEWGLQNISLTVEADNTVSIRLAEKLGFRKLISGKNGTII